MDFRYSEEQEAVRELAGQILAGRVTNELLHELERSDLLFDRELWGQLAEANLLGVALPEECDGSDLGLFALALLLEQAGRHLAPVPLIPTLVLGALPIAEFGSDAQRREFLPGVVRGERILTAALSEPVRNDVTQPQVAVKSDGDGFRLEGVKICVPAAQLAARVLVPATLEDGRVGVFLIAPDADGVRCLPVDVTSHEPHARLELAGVRVDADAVLGSLDEGAAIVQWIEERALVALSAMQLGILDEATRRTAAYTSDRQQFGRPIGSFQGVSLRAADAFIDTDSLRSTLWQAVWRLEAGLPASKEIRTAKWWACHAGHRVVHTASHLHGGMGADIEYPIHRYFYWAKQIELTLGGASVQLDRLGALIAEEARS